MHHHQAMHSQRSSSRLGGVALAVLVLSVCLQCAIAARWVAYVSAVVPARLTVHPPASDQSQCWDLPAPASGLSSAVCLLSDCCRLAPPISGVLQVTGSGSRSGSKATLNERPIIGILTEVSQSAAQQQHCSTLCASSMHPLLQQLTLCHVLCRRTCSPARPPLRVAPTLQPPTSSGSR